MKEFDWVVFKSREAMVHCKNNKEALNFIDSATKAGLYFFGGTESKEHGRYFRFDCHSYPFSEGEGCFQANIVDCADASHGNIIFEWGNYMPEEPTLKEKYFRTGYVVEFRDGDKYIVLRDGDEVALAEWAGNMSWCEWQCFEDYDDDLMHARVNHADIMKVYPRVCRWTGMLSTPIWQREEVKEITIKEAEHVLNNDRRYNVKVKIVGGEA